MRKTTTRRRTGALGGLVIAAAVVAINADAAERTGTNATKSSMEETDLGKAIGRLREVMNRARKETDQVDQKGAQEDTKLAEARRTEYLAQIEEKIKRNWLRPPGTAPGLQCVMRIGQIPGGEIVKADVLNSSGNAAFDRSVEEAVMRSSPLAVA